MGFIADWSVPPVTPVEFRLAALNPPANWLRCLSVSAPQWAGARGVSVRRCSPASSQRCLVAWGWLALRRIWGSAAGCSGSWRWRCWSHRLVLPVSERWPSLLLGVGVREREGLPGRCGERGGCAPQRDRPQPWERGAGAMWVKEGEGARTETPLRPLWVGKDPGLLPHVCVCLSVCQLQD